MGSYRARFDTLAATIASHPYLVVNEYRVGVGAEETSLAALQRDLGAPLDDAAMAFYREADGLTLRWGFDPRAAPDELDSVCMNCCEGYEVRMGFAFGTIQLRSVAQLREGVVLPGADLAQGDPTSVACASPLGVMSAAELFARALAFDDIDHGGDHACFVRGERSTGWGVLLVSGGLHDWFSSRVTTFDDYLGLLLGTWGISEARGKALYAPRGSHGVTERWTLSEEAIAAVRPKLIEPWWVPRRPRKARRARTR